jgi:hypothetical protein
MVRSVGFELLELVAGRDAKMLSDIRRQADPAVIAHLDGGHGALLKAQSEEDRDE